MPRTTFVLVAFIAALVGAIAMYSFNPSSNLFANAEPGLSENSVRNIVDQMLAEREEQAPESAAPIQVASAQLSQDQINPMIENYLMGDPQVLQRMSNALQAQIQAEESAAAKLSLATFESEIYDDPGHVVLGNPEGDVTLVEFFDYNCGFCRRAMADMAQLLEEDSNLRIILKEFPVLSENSVDAARVAVAVANTPGADYWAFHELLFTSRGQIGGETALAAAEQIGMNRVTLELESQGDATTQVLQRSYALAQELNITGTPAYVIGDEIIPGAVGVDALRLSISNMRECGSTTCTN